MNKKHIDVILIPGFGLDKKGNPKPTAQNRIKGAVKLYHQLENKPYMITLSKGSTHSVEILKKNKIDITESEASSKMLIENKVEAKHILQENISLDTIGNAYYSRLLHVEPRKFKNICIVVNKLQEKRFRKTFNWVYGIEGDYNITYKIVEDGFFDPKIVELLKKKEKEGILNIEKKERKIKTLKELMDFINFNHNAYNLIKSDEKEINSKLRELY